MYKADLSNARFYDTDLSHADLSAAVISGAFFIDSPLTAEQLYSTANYHARDLRGVRLSGDIQAIDLRNWDFSRQDLTQASLSRADLTSASFAGANLSGALLLDSNLTDADFSNADIIGAAISGPTGSLLSQIYATASYQTKSLVGISLERTELALANFAAFDLFTANFRQANLSFADFGGSNLARARFDLSVLEGANFTDALVQGAGFADSDLTAAQLYSTASYKQQDLSGVEFGYGRIEPLGVNTDLTGWNFERQNLRRSSFDNVTLVDAVFTDADIRGSSFSNTTDRGFNLDQLRSTLSYKMGDLTDIRLAWNDLTGWDLKGQNLTNAYLGDTVLRNSDLSGANLTNVDFEFCFFECFGSDFTNADLSGAMLKSAHLRSAVGLETALFSTDTVYNQWTVFPEDFDADAKGLTLVPSPPGDFNADDVLNASDIDSLIGEIHGHRLGRVPVHTRNAFFDLNGDSFVDIEDHHTWIKDTKRTWYGDANLDGRFDSDDLVEIFQSGKYEKGWLNRVGRPEGDEAGWSQGDWNGDGIFSSSDLVIAFQDGGYEQGPRSDAVAVPEPTTVLLFIAGVIGVAVCRRRLQP
jgi:uncharacterized protein YjbI with pentapeptide repeats